MTHVYGGTKDVLFVENGIQRPEQLHRDSASKIGNHFSVHRTARRPSVFIAGNACPACFYLVCNYCLLSQAADEHYQVSPCFFLQYHRRPRLQGTELLMDTFCFLLRTPCFLHARDDLCFTENAASLFCRRPRVLSPRQALPPTITHNARQLTKHWRAIPPFAVKERPYLLLNDSRRYVCRDDGWCVYRWIRRPRPVRDTSIEWSIKSRR